MAKIERPKKKKYQTIDLGFSKGLCFLCQKPLLIADAWVHISCAEAYYDERKKRIKKLEEEERIKYGDDKKRETSMDDEKERIADGNQP